jgi:uncharacterized membrane protein
MKKVIITSIAVLVGTMMMLSCSSDSKSIKERLCGKKWYPTKMEAGGKSEELKDSKAYYEYKSNDSMTMSKGEFADNYKYDLDEAAKTISIKGSDGNENVKQEILKIEGNHMEMNQTIKALNITMKMYFEAR